MIAACNLASRPSLTHRTAGSLHGTLASLTHRTAGTLLQIAADPKHRIVSGWVRRELGSHSISARFT